VNRWVGVGGSTVVMSTGRHGSLAFRGRARSGPALV
jgi:hypothetical protein